MQLKQFLIIYFLMTAIINCVIGINLWTKYDKLRQRLNKLLHRKKGTELLLDINEFEYPRANETLRAIHRQLWKEYYDCLKKSYSEMGIKKAIYPINIIALEGTFVMFNCEICISPTESYTTDNIEWYFNSSVSNETNKLIEDSENVLISPDDKRLMIYNIKLDQAGQYWCKLEDTLSTIVYYLSIDSEIKEIKTVYPMTAPKMPHAVRERIIPEYNLVVHTTWTKWSPCSTCDVVGKKVRYGYCTLSLHDNIHQNTETTGERSQNYKRQITKDEESEKMESTTEYEHSEIENTTTDEQTETIETTAQNKSLSEDVKNKVTMVLHMFRNKLPCKSKYLPREVLNLSDIEDRKTEMMIRYCKIKCSKNVMFEVRDNQGNVLESANNSAGVYSMVQGMPIPAPPVTRTVIYRNYKKKTALACPGNLNTDIPITWKLDNKVLNPSVIKEQSHGRIHINPQMHIVFASLKFEDTNIYSCWQKNEIAGVIKLNVVGEIEVQTNYTVIMTGGSLIIIVFLIVFWRAFKGRRRFTIH